MREKIFKYKSDFDKNGIIYYLGCNYGKSAIWKRNPSKLGLVTLDSSGLRVDSKSIDNFMTDLKKVFRNLQSYINTWKNIS